MSTPDRTPDADPLIFWTNPSPALVTDPSSVLSLRGAFAGRARLVFAGPQPLAVLHLAEVACTLEVLAPVPALAASMSAHDLLLRERHSQS